MRTYSYLGQLYSQGGSDLTIVSFCASANDVKDWGGVPSKTERFHGGFQRALSERYKKIKSFFDDAQASPTSVVVAFREATLRLSPLGYPPSWVSDASLSLKPQFVHISFDVDLDNDDEVSIEDLRARVAAILKPRLEDSNQQLGADVAAEDAEANDDEEPDSDSADLSEESDISEDVDSTETSTDDEAFEDKEAELDVGHSKLRAFYEFITSDDKVATWLSNETAKHAALSAQAKKTAKDHEALRYRPDERLRYSLLSLLRPAMIVDGQHRVWGAYHSDKAPITFSVCAIRDADWIEQVFQFVVLNKLAKPISPGFLTSILNTSLTNAEVNAKGIRCPRNRGHFTSPSSHLSSISS